MKINTFGNAIRNLRKKKNLTLEQLSVLSGIPFQTLGRIERGQTWPSMQWLDHFSKAFEVPVAMLLQEEGNTKPIIHYRGQSELSEDLKKNVDQIISCYSRLEDFCRAKKYQAFHLDIPLYDYIESEIEEAALQSRELLGIKNAIIFDLINLFESNGLRVVICKFPKGIDGFSYFSPKEKGVYFFLNSEDTTERKLFTLAHELGHLIFHQGGTKYLVAQSTADSDIVEKASTYFASCFLMPQKAIINTITQLGITHHHLDLELILSLKKRFSVSAESFVYRLFELEIISRKQKENFIEDIRHDYAKNDNKEPSPADITLNENQRLKDLLLISSKDEKHSEEAKKIQKTLISLGVVL